VCMYVWARVFVCVYVCVRVCVCTGPVFGNKDYFVGLAIFLDTYANQNGPHNVSIYNVFGTNLTYSLQ